MQDGGLILVDYLPPTLERYRCDPPSNPPGDESVFVIAAVHADARKPLLPNPNKRKVQPNQDLFLLLIECYRAKLSYIHPGTAQSSTLQTEMFL